MSACTVSTLDCAALGTTTWPSLLSHRVWAAVTLRSLSPGQRKASRCSSSSTCMHVHRHLLQCLLFFTQEIHKETWDLFTSAPNSIRALGTEKHKQTSLVEISHKTGCSVSHLFALFFECVSLKQSQHWTSSKKLQDHETMS